MGKKLSPGQSTLYRRTDEILHYIWDPIGVGGSAGARDEYHAYLPRVFNLLIAGSGEEAVAEYLLRIEREAMCLTPDRVRAREVARLLAGHRDAMPTDAS